MGEFFDFIKEFIYLPCRGIIFLVIRIFFGRAGDNVSLIFRVIAGLYWLWSPVYWASIRNGKFRRYRYISFWRGKVLDVYLTEELIKEESAIDKLGRAIIVENRRKLFNIEIGDKTGFRATITTPRQRIHKVVNRGQGVEGLLLSNDPDFMSIGQITDVYIPRHKLWLGDYPYIRRDIFLDLRLQLMKIYGR